MANVIAETLLAGSAIYVAGRMLRGYRCERLSERQDIEEGERLLHKADANTHFAVATYQRPALLAAVLVGALLKLAVVLAGVFFPPSA